MFKRTRLALCCAAVLAMSLPAAAQYFVPQGNVTDRNNMLGSGGINYGASRFQPNLTNPYVTGNVTAGASFRGYSPVRDSSSFFLGSAPGRAGSGLLPGLSGGVGALPSDRLTTFRRDSVGMSELGRLPVAPTRTPVPFYSPSSTVTDTGQIIRGLNQPGTSQLQSPYVPLQRDAFAAPSTVQDASRQGLLGSPLATGGTLIRTETGQTLTGPVNTRLLGSPLFGSVRQVPGAQPTLTAGLPGTGESALAQRRIAERDLAAAREPGRTRDGGVDPRTGSPMDRLLSPQDREAARMGSPLDANRTQPGASRDGLQTDGTQDRLSRRIDEQDPTAAQQDQAAGSLARPVRTFDDAGPTAAADRRTAGLRQGQARAEDMTLRTFTGTEDERLRAELAEAGALLADQRYYDAARRYSMAHAIDLHNPLPLLGRSMSLLAAGDYISSSNDLFQAIQVAGPARAATLELEQFTPDLAMLDRRRASLEQQLEVFDDFRLRFLLGWAEYISGMPDLGIANMTKAATAMPPHLDDVRRFVEILATRPTTQPADSAATQPAGR